jgi:hypothetical protein
MALAILEPQAFEPAGVRLKVDTGTNRYYRLKVGKSVGSRYGFDWIDDVFFSSPIRANDHGGSLLDSSTDVVIPLRELKNENSYAYVQLFSFKSQDGKSPAFSKVIKVPVGLASGDLDFPLPLSTEKAMNTGISFRSPRPAIPCVTLQERFAQTASIEDLLSGILKVAAPVVVNLLGNEQKKDGSANSKPGSTASPGGSGIGDILTLILKSVLSGLQGSTATAVSQSLPVNGSNRFANGRNSNLAHSFIFGIDDALFGALIGQVVQVLPQLANAATQQRIQLKQANNKLITDILSDVNRRMLLEQLLQAQQQPKPGTQPGDSAALNQLVQLLQQAQGPSTSQSLSAPRGAVAQILSLDAAPPLQMSRAVISFPSTVTLTWNGSEKAVYSKASDIQLPLRLVVGDPVPKSPLAKAIVKFVFKAGSDGSVVAEKTFKQKDVAANVDLPFTFSPAETAGLPANKVISVVVEMRWPDSKGGSEHKALGSSEIVLVNKYFVKAQGAAVSPERELTDMSLYRPFWNKIWESPSLDAAGNPDGDNKKYLWELDVNTKYTVLLSTEHPTNGLMQTKLLNGPADDDSLTARTAGRMKGGIELSLGEVSKLASLWDAEKMLNPDQLDALRTDTVAQNGSGEFMDSIKLKGKASERGMVWVVPAFRLFEFTLGSVQKVDSTGRVTSVNDEKVRFPLPVAGRVLGVKSDK